MKNENIYEHRDGANTSIWETVAINSDGQTPLPDQVYDVIIIGAGITGVTTALQLQQQGKRCLLVEARQSGFGTTGGTTAHLNTFLDTTYPEIDSAFGKDASKLVAKATKKSIQNIYQNLTEIGFDADFVYLDGYLFSQNDEETKMLNNIFESAVEAGVDVEVCNENGLPIKFDRSIKFLNQAQFHPLKYIQGLLTEFQRLGGIYLDKILIDETRAENEIQYAYSNGLAFKGKNIVWSTHIPPGINVLSLRNAPYRSYVLAVRLKNEDYPQSLSYDSKEPYHYFRTHEIGNKKYLIIGGEDHKTGHDDSLEAFSKLEEFAHQNFDILSIDFRWSSQYYVPVDGLPYIGLLPGENNVYVSTGYNGNGMIFGTIAGTIISDLILDKPNELAELLKPSRLKPVAGFKEFVKENADVAYHFVADRFNLKSLSSLKDLATDEGKIVSVDGQKLAIYKTDGGEIKALNAVCTHAGCIVAWNRAEKSWDCPCHGGRFAIDGSVLTGPPTKCLATVEIHENGDKSIMIK